MLKRLELVGFKSFADKTQFDFPSGITAIVGPNGSGKSNIVDAVRWLLGEQSAKSLRGGDMTDVIFNGSTSRRSLGLAEVTMTFDNSRGLLRTDASEVQITRRVYRSGEGEYLINQQPCRLKDIKDLFLGSGAGADAYSIIEQGKVDILLQSSTRERRTIFEEAAGISRFKARKTETLRKLEKVELNLQRLRDILEEVEKQLRSVKLQASKAQRWREYSCRLRELRVGLGLMEYRELTAALAARQEALDQLRGDLDVSAKEADQAERETRRVEHALQHLQEAIRDQEASLAQARQHIAASEAALRHERTTAANLEAELSTMRTHLVEIDSLVADLADKAARGGVELAEADAEDACQRERVRAVEEALAEVVEQLAVFERRIEADRAAHHDQAAQAARLRNDVQVHVFQMDTLRHERQRLTQKSGQAAEHLATLDARLRELSGLDEDLQGRLGAAKQLLAEQRQQRDCFQTERDEAAQRLADLAARRSGLVSRIEVLEGLERSQEGLGAGVREVLAAVQRAAVNSPWSAVLGMVADLLTVPRESAALIEVALGEVSQRFVVRDLGVVAALLGEQERSFASRVGFVPLQEPSSSVRLLEVWPPRPPVHPGLVASADSLVRCASAELADLPAKLLGRTLIVRDLAAARELASMTSGYRFVTLKGEMLDADGSLLVGPNHSESGILSRKSELRELRELVSAVDVEIARHESDLAVIRAQLVEVERRLGKSQEEIDLLSVQAADLRERLGQERQRRDAIHEEVSLGKVELERLDRDLATLDRSLTNAARRAEEAEQQAQLLHEQLGQAEQQRREMEETRRERQHDVATARVALAQLQERLAALRARQHQLDTDLAQRQHEQHQANARLRDALHRLHESQHTMLRVSETLARAYLDKEAAERRVAELTREYQHRRDEREAIQRRLKAFRETWRERQEQAHARELEVSELRHRRQALVEKLREAYQIDLAAIDAESARNALESAEKIGSQTESAEQSGPLTDVEHGAAALLDGEAAAAILSPEDARAEIDELQRKIHRLGSVNLEALQELEELELRSRTLHAQHDDLAAAQKALQEIISRINEDSRKLFLETFTAIRAHFQELFRKLFGGGMADIVLEDESDVLESGIEVVARPPGKQLSRISLMSGGEKSLTAVALLLAIFRSKPSPFCILDEVDAALDEANIARYAAVLREFLDRSQFILITHSKKTMATADVLYGITMQESGVSKRVAVKFEDWKEDGPLEGGGEANGLQENFAGR